MVSGIRVKESAAKAMIVDHSIVRVEPQALRSRLRRNIQNETAS
jgi:hypothetical protein